MRLSRFYRRLVYWTLTLLVLSGAAWIVADQLKAGDDAEFWQRTVATALMVHGGAAMIMLLLLGILIESHMRRAWRARRNRATGVVMIAFNTLLVVSAFLLYYAGSETLRPWISNGHIVLGLAMPVLVLLHVIVGRRARRGNDAGT